MSTDNKPAFGILIPLLLAGLFIVITLMLMGLPGLIIFGIADFPLSILLPKFHGDYLLETGIYYGITWPLLMVGVYIFSVKKRIPEKWIKSPESFQIKYGLILAAVTSICLSLVFHVYMAWETYKAFGSEFYK